MLAWTGVQSITITSIHGHTTQEHSNKHNESIEHDIITLLSIIALKIFAILSNELIKRISISIIINKSIVLELLNFFTLLNGMIYSFLNWIPSSVSSIMSMSNATIIHHHPISLYLSIWNSNPLLWIEIEKGDLINQSLSFILFIFNSFDSAVAESP